MTKALFTLFASATLLVACGAPVDDVAETAEEQLTVVPTEVDVRIAAFIPCDAVSSPEPRFSHYYAGDNRGFDFELAMTRSRTAVDVVVDSTKAPVIRSIVGESKAYNRSEIASGPAGQCYSLDPDATVARRKTADGSRVGATVSSWANGTRFDEIRLGLHAKNPLAWLSPNLDADVTVTIEYARVGTKYVPAYFWVDGVHDGFPAYELYVGGKSVYLYDGLEREHDAFWLSTSGSRPQEHVWIARRPIQTTAP